MEELKARIPEARRVEEVAPGYIVVEVGREDLEKAAGILKEMGFDHVASVEGVDYPDDNEIEVAYHAESYEPGLSGIIVKLSARLPRENPETKSLIGIWPNALYPERETWEMLGVVFKGHPELKHLLLPPDWRDKPPLRKDFKIPVEGIIVDLTRAS